MSESIRQSNLFAGEDYKRVFQAYQFIDYTAYDFDTLKQALLNYIQTYYPEDFNDYIESSEFIAIIELLAYFGTSLAFRTDLNSRENFIDTAERRESIIRLAQMVNYVPRRNVPASGLFKIAAVQTNQPLVDANGVNINDLTIYWNDPNNPDWFDQFVQVCNASFSTLNPFGRPTKSGIIGSIPTDLYQLNNIIRLNVTYPTSITINSQEYPIDICNPDFITNETIFEKDPDPANAFNFIYRNDSLGVSSSNTGFFLYFKQGNLLNIDTNFEFPVPNRLFPIDIQNINQDDVYVQETDQSGNVINKWVKVPALSGENIIYNSIQNAQRNIFDVITGANDTITIRFADGNFGNVPTGLFRTWIRTSANQSIVIRPNDAQGLQINIPYLGADQQHYTLKIIFNLEQTIGNSAPTETNEQIKLRAPEVFSTQSRMVNGSDYNILPLIYGNQIAKIQAFDRTYSGQSRYIDLNDPTGFHHDLLIFGQDGALYRDNQNVLVEIVKDSSNLGGTIESILVNTIQEMLRDSKVSKFFYDEYLTQFESTVRVNPPGTGRSLLDLVPSTIDPSSALYWGTSPVKFKNITGYFASTQVSTSASANALINTLNPNNLPNSTYQAWAFIKDGSVIDFVTPDGVPSTASVNTVIQDGNPIFINPLNPYANVGPVELGVEVQNGSQAVKVYPAFRNTLTLSEINGDLPNGIYGIIPRIADSISFWLYYDLLQDVWNTSTTLTPGVINQTYRPFVYAPTDVGSIYSSWGNHPDSGLLYIDVTQDSTLGTTAFGLTARGRTYIFESYRDVRFYWEPNQIIIDNASGQALKDTIEIMPFVNTNNLVNNNSPVIPPPPIQPYINLPVGFNISDVFIQDDGYLDPAKVAVDLIDENNDGIPDNPSGVDSIVSQTDRIVFEYYDNVVSGYQGTRPWIARWGTGLENYTGRIYVYFPVDQYDITKLYGSPFLSNMPVSDIYNPIATPGAIILYMDDYDLIFLNNETQLSDIASQVSLFFNNIENIINYGVITSVGNVPVCVGYTPGVYYNVPLISVTGTGSGATATITIGTSNGISTLGTPVRGTGYTPGTYINTPLIYASGSGPGSGATATITIFGAGITSATAAAYPAVYTPGTYLNVPLFNTTGTGSGATATIVLGATGQISGIGAISPGSGYPLGVYSNVPLIGGSGSGATAQVSITSTPGTGALAVLSSLTTPNTVAMTAQDYTGTRVYVCGSGSNSVYFYPRNTTTGLLTNTPTNSTSTSILNPISILISWDGNFMYIMTRNNGIYTCSLNVGTGAANVSAVTNTSLTPYVSPMIMSYSGTSVYVSDRLNSQIALYPRNGSTGVIGGAIVVSTGSVPEYIAISPDDKNVYTANIGDDTITIFTRNPANGSLTFLSPVAVGDTPMSITISVDGLYVYVGRFTNNDIVVYSRNSLTGALTFISSTPVGTTMAGSMPISLSVDGTNLYVAEASGVTSFMRDPFSGAIYSPTVLSISSYLPRVMVSYDDKNVYLLSDTGPTLTTCSRTTTPTITTSASITTPGINYTVGNVLTASNSSLGGSGAGFSIPVSSVSTSIPSVSIVTPGSGYAISNQLYASYTNLGGVGNNLNVVVSAVSTPPTTVSITSPGANYIAGNVLTASSIYIGVGTGFTVPVNSVTTGTIPTVSIVNRGANYAVSNILSANVSDLGGTGSGFSTSVISVHTDTSNIASVLNKIDIVTNNFINKSFLISPLLLSPPGYGIYKLLQFHSTSDPTFSTGQIIIFSADTYHYDKNGKVFTQNMTISEANRLPFYFKWSHYSPIDQRVDPSPTNIIDMIVITNSYYQDMIIWKNSNGTAASLPVPPTTEELRIQFQSLNQYKMVSDSMIWNSGVFKILFGTQAPPELQATFKVVKAPSTNISDNEVKTRVIQAIDTYFDIRNWDFGEKFFYTELAAFIHQQLSRIISSVVIVPTTANSQFGNLFEIIASPNQLFISSATVNNVQIVANLTEQNLRV